MQQQKAVFWGTQLKPLSWQRECRQQQQPSLQPGLLLVSTGYASSHQEASSQVWTRRTMCRQQDWLHSPAGRCGMECINQWRAGWEVPGSSHQGPHLTFSSAASEHFPYWHGNVNNYIMLPVPVSPEREKEVYGSICLLLFGFLCCSFDKIYFHSHDTEAAAEEIALALRIGVG